MAGWAGLPSDAIEAISKRLTNGADYVRLRSVCTSWRSAAPRRPRLPWFTVGFKGELRIPDIGLYDVSSGEVVEIQLPTIPGLLGRRFCGPHRGWMPLINRDPGISLLNFFTGATIRTPAFTEIPDKPHNFGGVICISKAGDGYLLQKRDGSEIERLSYELLALSLPTKVVLSSDPVAAPDGCVVMISLYYGACLAFCTLRDDSWTLLQRPSKDTCFHDVIFFEDQFYALYEFRLFVLSLGPMARAIEIPPADPLFDEAPSDEQSYSSHLVESSGELLLVRQGLPRPRSFEVFRVDLRGQLRLSKLKSLGGRALFLGDHCFSLPGCSLSGCKGNCIYYIDGSKIATFNMEDDSTSFSDDSCANWCPIHWITPSLGY